MAFITCWTCLTSISYIICVSLYNCIICMNLTMCVHCRQNRGQATLKWLCACQLQAHFHVVPANHKGIKVWWRELICFLNWYSKQLIARMFQLLGRSQNYRLFLQWKTTGYTLSILHQTQYWVFATDYAK